MIPMVEEVRGWKKWFRILRLMRKRKRPQFAYTARVGALDEEGHMEGIVLVGRLLDAVVDIMLVIASVILAFHFWNEWRRG